MKFTGIRITFTYKRTPYSVGGKAYESGYIVLPDGTVLHVQEWEEGNPPRIIKLEEIANPKGGSLKTIEQRFDAARAREEPRVKTGGMSRHKNPRIRKTRP